MEESKVPTEQRFLLIEGIVNKDVSNKVFKNFTSKMRPTSVCCFVSFAYADLPIGKRFEIVFSYSEPLKYTETLIEISSVTQQFGFETEVVPHGWGTICIFDFPDGIPEIVLNLPIVGDWHLSDAENQICISNKETFEVIKSKIE